jgi:hypothetical protein
MVSLVSSRTDVNFYQALSGGGQFDRRCLSHEQSAGVVRSRDLAALSRGSE